MNFEAAMEEIYLIGAIGTIMNKDDSVVIDEETQTLSNLLVLDNGLKIATTITPKKRFVKERSHLVDTKIKVEVLGYDEELEGEGPLSGLVIRRNLDAELLSSVPYKNSGLVAKLRIIKDIKPTKTEKMKSYFNYHHYLSKQEVAEIKQEAENMLSWASLVASEEISPTTYGGNAYTFKQNQQNL